MVSIHNSNPISPSICYLPPLFPDELIYSWLGRLVLLNSFDSPRIYLELLFGTKNIVPGIDLPTRLESLFACTNPKSQFDSIDHLINTGTLYPYHRPFLPSGRHERVQQILLRGCGKGLKTLLGRVANRFGANPPLRYCAVCLVNDIINYGSSYWHRIHQLPGITCCANHRIELTQYVLPVTSSDKQRIILTPGKAPLPSNEVISDTYQFGLAKLSQNLLESSLPTLDEFCRQSVYINAILAMGFRNKRNRVDHEGLAYGVQSHYKNFEGFIHKDRLLATPAYPLRWLRTLVDQPSRSSHPLCHLLLIGFLFGTIDRFMQAMRTVDRIEDGQRNTQRHRVHPLPLKDTAPQHDHLLHNIKLSCRELARILKLSVTTVVSRRRAIGVRIAERRKHLDSKQLKSISRDLAKGLSLCTIAKSHNVSMATVYRIRSQSHELLQAHVNLRQKQTRRTRRRMWRAATERYGNSGLNAVRSKAASDYAWLYRHDRQWLQKICKTLPTSRKPQLRVDWNERDIELSRSVKAHVDKLKSNKNRRRISKTLMIRHIGDAMVRRNLTKLPRLFSVLESLEESSYCFQLFRIERAIEQLNSQGLPLTFWRLQRAAGIRQWTESLRIHAYSKAVFIRKDTLFY